MEITYKKIPLINFPVFGLLNTADIYVEDGILFFGGSVLDDRNQDGETLGMRRLQTPLTNLYRLKYCFPELGNMLTNKKFNVYIDNKGFCFKYLKTKYMDVVCHKIKEVQLQDTHTLIKMHRVHFPLITQAPPPSWAKWVSVIYIGKHPWLPYEYNAEHCPNRKRKI